MPYSMNWLIENEIIYSRYFGVSTTEELRENLRQVQAMIDISPRNVVHIISDAGDVTEAVPLRESFTVVRELGAHPRLGWTLTIREKSVLIKMGSGLASSIFTQNFRAFDTIEQALAHLKHVDSTLSWDKIDHAVLEQIGS